jgi:hypothetical protein
VCRGLASATGATLAELARYYVQALSATVPFVAATGGTSTACCFAAMLQIAFLTTPKKAVCRRILPLFASATLGGAAKSATKCGCTSMPLPQQCCLCVQRANIRQCNAVRYVQAQANASAQAAVPVDDQRLVRLVDKIVINQGNR